MNLLIKNKGECAPPPPLKKYGVIVRKGKDPEKIGFVVTRMSLQFWCLCNGYMLVEKRSETNASINDKTDLF